MNRRDFLKTSGSFVILAKLGGLTGCSDDGGGSPDSTQLGMFQFPQGVASGDPRSTSVMLWTRVVATAGGTADIAVTVQVSTTDDFASVVAEQVVTASAASDFTLRILVDALAPNTNYYYRFRAGPGPDASDVGRTWTAPTRTADVPLNLAWVSCQDYEAGFHGAYRELLNDDAAAAAADKIHAVVHLGDFIYESQGSRTHQPLDANFQPIAITDRAGRPRALDPFPSGGTFATTLDDYRHHYKQYLRDPELRAARAWWPFIQTWDDHEFTNDGWQSMANYTDVTSLDEPSQTRRIAANRAWFEFIPAVLTQAEGVPGVPNPAHDFVDAAVTNAPFGTVVDDDNLATEANNLAAIGSIAIHRSLRLGAHVELVVTDERSYRSDHAIPEELIYQEPYFFDPRNVMSAEMALGMDAGRDANNMNPPPDFHGVYPNPNMTRAPGTMLGGPQKAWWKATMMGSDATWKVWANEVPLMRMFLKNPGVLVFDRVFNVDAWDGYNHERTELMTFLRANGIRNVVAITGDVHGHWAGLVMEDHEVATPQPAMVELIAAGVSSNSVFSFFEYPTRTQPAPLRRLVTYDATALGGTNRFVENINLFLLYGPQSADTMATTNNFAQAQAARDLTHNPHILYADCNAQGYGILKVTATGVTAHLVTINRPITDPVGGPGKKRTATFTIPLAGPGDTPTLTAPTFTGTPPFPFDPTT